MKKIILNFNGLIKRSIKIEQNKIKYIYQKEEQVESENIQRPLWTIPKLKSAEPLPPPPPPPKKKKINKKRTKKKKKFWLTSETIEREAQANIAQ